MRMAAGDSGTEMAQNEALDSSFDYMFKILMVGNSGVGKTTFLIRYCENVFQPAFVSTVGIDFKVKTIYRGDKVVKLQVWDTAGQERYRTITTSYYRGAMGFILMFDITNEDSFSSVDGWMSQIRDLSLANTPAVIVGNKSDLAESRVVSHERGTELARSLGLKYIETSAKDDIGVKDAFDCLIDEISEKMAEIMERNPNLRETKRVRAEKEEEQPPSTSSCSC